MQVAVIDTSCFIALDSAGLLAPLTWIYPRVLMPVAVREELTRKIDRTPQLDALRDVGLFADCTDYDRASIETIVPPERQTRLRDVGEAEAMVQAAIHGAIVLTDDAWARDQASLRSLRVKGSLGIVIELHALGSFTAEAARTALELMQQAGCRLPVHLVNQFLEEIGQPPLLGQDPSGPR